MALASVFALLALSFSSMAATEAPRVQLLGGSESEVQIDSNGTVRHKAANFVFPEWLADMPLRKVIIYGPADLSVDYTFRGGGNGDAWITLFVYPAKKPFAEEVPYIERNLLKATSATRIVAPGPPPSTAIGGSGGWFKGVHGGVSLTTGFMLVQRGSWFVQARFTIPDQAGSKGVERTLQALAAVPWNWRPVTTRPQ